MFNPYFDKQFLKQLDYHNNKTTYIKITALNQKNEAIESIEGKATGGNINIQGSSAVRRTCSLTLSILNNDTIITDIYWAFKNKFRLEIGILNEIDTINYPKIIWFKQGIYVINSFSKSQSTNNLTISISGQDKMCLLNGTLGGSMAHETDFGTIETEDENGDINIEKITVYDIVKNAILMYGQERPENIVINDLDEIGYELLEYRGDTPMYLFLDSTNTKKVQNICFETNSLIKNISKFYSLNTLDSSYNSNSTSISLDDNNTSYVAKIEYGETAGYHQTPLVYPDDLILKVGEPITALLDKIKNMLGNYEYFYDIDGKFVFQKKKTYTQELFNPANGEIKVPLAAATPYSYQFNDTKLFTTISNNPKVNNIKNDYSIWGVRKSISGSNLPIHVRYAIDDKPLEYNSPYDQYVKVNNLYYIVATEIKKEELVEGSMVWEALKENENIIGYVEVAAAAGSITYYNLSQTKEYPMIQEMEEDGETPKTDKDGNYIMIPENEAKVEIGYKTSPNSFEIKDKNNPNSEYFKFLGLDDKNKPQYEQLPNKYYDLDNNEDFLKIIYIKIPSNNRYYNIPTTDYQEIIYQMAYDYYQYGDEPDYIQKISENNPKLLKNGKTGYEQYYTDLQGFWRQLYNPDTIYDETTGQMFYDENGVKPFWNKKIHTDPNSLVFWFELLDLNEFNNYSVKNIGLRTKVDNQATTTGIFYKETPEALFLYTGETKESNNAYTPLQLNKNMEDLFSRSTQGVSAIQRANDLIYEHTQLGETLSLTSIPIYYLEPNTRIYIQDEGDCVIDSISYQLSHSGLMNLGCTKIIKPFNI